VLGNVYDVAFFGLNDQTYPRQRFDNYAKDDRRALTLAIGGLSNYCNGVVRLKVINEMFFTIRMFNARRMAER